MIGKAKRFHLYNVFISMFLSIKFNIRVASVNKLVEKM